MKKLMLMMMTAVFSITAMSQSQRELYRAPQAPSVFTFTDGSFEVDPLDDLKYGTMYLTKADNSRLMGTVLIITGTLISTASLNDNNYNTNGVFGNILTLGGLGLHITGKVQQRKGLERLYLGMNGITIKLN